MENIKIEKKSLLEIIKKNRAEHEAIFLKAQEGFRKTIIEVMELGLAAARAGKKVDRVLWTIEPMNQTKDYDRAIRMIEMSVDDTVELSEDDFNSYVLDDWSWKERFTVNNVTSGYSSKR